METNNNRKLYKFIFRERVNRNVHNVWNFSDEAKEILNIAHKKGILAFHKTHKSKEKSGSTIPKFVGGFIYERWSILEARFSFFRRTKNLRNNSKSTYAIFRENQIDGSKNPIELRKKKLLSKHIQEIGYKPFCNDFPWNKSHDIIGVQGTAFAVSPNFFLTARHNVIENYMTENEKDISKKLILVREYREGKENVKRDIKKFKIHDFGKRKKDDWALIELIDGKENEDYCELDWEEKSWEFEKSDRLFLSRNDVSTKTQAKNYLEKLVEIYSYGHPLGLSQKFFYDSQILWNKGSRSFLSNIDAFNGCSGSPVFSAATDKVIGLLYQGFGSLIEENGCTKVKRVNSIEMLNNYEGEEIIKASYLAKKIKKTIIKDIQEN